MTNKPRKLNAKQVHILKLIYKFRFVTAGLLAERRGVRKWAIQNALKILTDSGYVARRYDKSYKIDRKPAAYHLTNQAIKLLRDEHGLNRQVLHARYKDRSVGQPFIDHSLAVFQTYLDIKKENPDTFKIFTKAELADYDYFSQPLPDLYLTRLKPSSDKPMDYIIDIFDQNVQSWVVKKRIDQYIEHFDEGDWIEETYPSVVLLVSNSRTAETLNNYIEKKKDEAYLEDELIIRAIKADGTNFLDS